MKYSKEFKKEVLRHYIYGSTSLQEVAWQFQISVNTLIRWREAYWLGKLN